MKGSYFNNKNTLPFAEYLSIRIPLLTAALHDNWNSIYSIVIDQDNMLIGWYMIISTIIKRYNDYKEIKSFIYNTFYSLYKGGHNTYFGYNES